MPKLHHQPETGIEPSIFIWKTIRDVVRIIALLATGIISAISIYPSVQDNPFLIALLILCCIGLLILVIIEVIERIFQRWIKYKKEEKIIKCSKQEVCMKYSENEDCIIHKKGENWVECDQFPYSNGKHICRMVSHCLSQSSAYRKNASDSGLIKDENNPIDLAKRLYDEVAVCLRYCGISEIRMTLPQNPYIQLSSDLWENFIKTARAIDQSEIKIKEKIIDLNRKEFVSFIQSLVRDLKNFPQDYKKMDFYKYISAHNDFNISLQWNYHINKSIPEFIIFDQSAIISCNDSQFTVDFSFEKIRQKYEEYGLVQPVTTYDFLSSTVSRRLSLMQELFTAEEQTITNDDVELVRNYIVHLGHQTEYFHPHFLSQVPIHSLGVNQNN